MGWGGPPENHRREITAPINRGVYFGGVVIRIIPVTGNNQVCTAWEMDRMSDTTPEYVSIAEFCRRSSLSRGSVYNEIERGRLPPLHRLTESRVGLPAEGVEAWFAARRADVVTMGEAA